MPRGNLSPDSANDNGRDDDFSGLASLAAALLRKAVQYPDLSERLLPQAKALIERAAR